MKTHFYKCFHYQLSFSSFSLTPFGIFEQLKAHPKSVSYMVTFTFQM